MVITEEIGGGAGARSIVLGRDQNEVGRAYRPLPKDMLMISLMLVDVSG